jgi:hypothetical protein
MPAALRYANSTLASRRVCLLTGPVQLLFCVFRLCVNDAVPGGALFILAPASLSDCLFCLNSAPSAGSVYCSGNLSLASVTFDGGFSPDAAALVSEGALLSASLTLFMHLSAGDHGAFRRAGGANASIVQCNFTSLHADGRNGAFAVRECPATVAVSLFAEMSARADAALAFCGPAAAAALHRCVFWLVEAKRGSIVAAREGAHVNATVITFVSCRASGRYMQPSDGAVIRVAGLCTDRQLHEVGDQVEFSDDHELGRGCGERFAYHLPTKIGYRKVNRQEERVTRKADIRDGLVLGVLLTAIFAFGLVIASMIVSQVVKLFTGERDEYDTRFE